MIAKITPKSLNVIAKITPKSLNMIDKISQQPENRENHNDPDLVQAFLKKWWVESDFKAPNLPLSLSTKMLKIFFFINV
jgi:hypothetical protein